MENQMINQWDCILVIFLLIITGGHRILRPEHAHNMDVENPVTELDTGGEDLYQNSTERDDPAPAALQGNICNISQL